MPTLGAEELQALREHVSAACAQHVRAIPRLGVLRRVLQYARWRLRVDLGRMELAREHQERDLRQFLKLKRLFDAAKRDGLLPGGFDFRSAGDAWWRRRAEAATAPAAAAATGEEGGGEVTNRQAEDDRRQHTPEEAGAVGEHGQPGEVSGPSARQMAAMEDGEGAAAAAEQHCAAGEDYGVPPWKSLLAELGEEEEGDDEWQQVAEHQQHVEPMVTDEPEARTGAGAAAGRSSAQDVPGGRSERDGRGPSLRELLMDEDSDVLRELEEEGVGSGDGGEQKHEVEEEEGGAIGEEEAAADAERNVAIDEEDEEEEFRF